MITADSWRLVDSVSLADALDVVQNHKDTFWIAARTARVYLNNMRRARLYRATSPDTIINLMCGDNPVSPDTREELLARLEMYVRDNSGNRVGLIIAKETMTRNVKKLGGIRNYKHLRVTKNDRHLLERMDTLNTDPGRSTRIFDATITPIENAGGARGLVITGRFYTKISKAAGSSAVWNNVINVETGQVHERDLLLRLPITRLVVYPESQNVVIETQSRQRLVTMAHATGSGSNRRALYEFMLQVYRTVHKVTRGSMDGVDLTLDSVRTLPVAAEPQIPDIDNDDMPSYTQTLHPSTHNPCVATRAYLYDPTAGVLVESSDRYVIQFFSTHPGYSPDIVKYWAKKYPIFRDCAVDPTLQLRGTVPNIFSPALIRGSVWR